MNPKEENKNITTLWSVDGLWVIVKALSVVMFLGVVAFKIIVTPFSLTIDFSAVLSLLLALFSVGLAALFYFKATETSNTFYNNTYNFTKDIAQLLVKIESGFGERLRNLDEGYSSMRDYLQNNKGNQSSFEDNSASETTKQKIQSERDELEKVLNERNQIIEGLIERSNLQEEEKRSVVADLKRKEEELRKVHQDLNRMNRRLVIERMGQKNRMLGEIDFDSGAVNFTEKVVVKALGADW